MKAMLSVCFFLFVFTINCVAQPASQQPVGSVLDVIGAVSVTRAGKTDPLNLFENLFIGDIVRVAKDARFFLAHNLAKTEYWSTAPSEFEIASNGVTLRSGGAPVAKKMSDFAAAATVLPVGGGKTSVGAVRMRSLVAPETVPSNRDTVTTLSPLFSWPPFSPGMTYVFTLTQSARKIAMVSTKETSVRLTAGQTLAWGGEYEWTLTIDETPEKLPVVRTFKIVDRSTIDNLLLLTPSETAAFSEWVIYARALEAAGAFTAAREVWRRLAKARPDNQALAALAK